MKQTVLRYTKNITKARAEIENIGGRVLQEFTPSVFEAELPDSADLSSLKYSQPLSNQRLDETSHMAAEAWVAKQQKADNAPTPSEGLSWDSEGYSSPLSVDDAPELSPDDGSGVMLSTGTPTSRYMVGSVAVGLVIVSRNQGAEVMSPMEQTKVIQEVQEGLSWLASVEPRARVSFIYDIQRITVNVAPGPNSTIGDAYERYEQGWRDAALEQMGFPPGRDGYREYVNQLRDRHGTNWAYVAFFTKYPLNHFAYAVGEKVVMAYTNDNWGVDVINSVFAHETCHIFGASDEYGGCTCGESHGELGIPNNNCRNCAGVKEDCLMNRNTLQMCHWSRGQIGWDERLFPQN